MRRIPRSSVARRAVGAVALALALGACGPAAMPAGGDAERPAPVAAGPQKTLTVLITLEPQTLTSRVSIGSAKVAQGLFNAGLAYVDNQNAPHPYLVDELPRLGTGTWRVFPDGRMETVYQLRPGLVWHDGAPLTAEDLVFTQRVVTNRSSKLFPKVNQPSQLEAIVATDPRTVTFRWNGPAREAGQQLYQPLPQHILGPAFDAGDDDAFANRPYWTTEYVQLGAYRLERWEPGAFIEGSAFAQHALGVPRIGRLRIVWAADPSAAVANLLAGEVTMATDGSLSFESAMTLKRAWEQSRAGTVLLSPTSVQYLQIQFRPEYLRPAALLNTHVRKALAHSIDKAALADSILEGAGSYADTFEPSPDSDGFAAVQEAITKYPFDARQADELLHQAGFQKGADGFYTASSGRLDPELRGRAGQEERTATIVVDNWRRAGLDASLLATSGPQASNQELRSTFPGLAIGSTVMGSDTALGKLVSWNAATPSNRWTGSNRGGWSSPEYDRLITEYNASLESSRQLDTITQAMQLMTAELPAIPLFYSYDVAAYRADLIGPQGALDFWNVQEWDWR